jgi:menaquinone-9 beta-reductase
MASQPRQPAHPPETGALIVGGGPAGLAVAIALRQRGVECVVVEARSPGIDKACGEGLMPGAIESLARLGVHINESEGHPFRGIRFENPAHRVDANFPHGAGIGVRRPRLHSLLADRAEEEGACVLWNSRIQLPNGGPSGESGVGREVMRCATVNGRAMRFRWLVGADGQASQVRRWAALDRARTESFRYGFRTHYRIAPWSEFVEVHWGLGGQLYITPVASDCVCVAYITRDAHCDRAAILADFPEVARRLSGASHAAETVSQQRGAVSATRKLRRVAYDFVALVGDASGSADSITGEGLAVSFRHALALAEAIHSGSLAPYRRAHKRIGQLPHIMGALMLTLDRWPGFEARAVHALAANPALFREMLSVHTGERSMTPVLLRRGPSFAWSLCRNEAVLRVDKEAAFDVDLTAPLKP